MQAKYLLSLLLLAFYTVVFTACDKNENAADESPKTTLDKQLLTDQIWQCEKMLYNGSSVGSYIDISTITFLFEGNGTYKNTFMSQQSSGKWELVPNKDQILIDKGTGNELLLDVTLSTKDKLNFEFDEPDSNPKRKVQYNLVH